MEGRVSRLSGCPELLPMSFAMRYLLLFIFAGLAIVSAPVAWAQDEGANPPAATDRLADTNPLLAPPETPEQEFSVVLLMVDLGRLDLARQYLDKFMAGQPSNDLLLALRDKHGSAAFLKLSQTKELQPASQELIVQLGKAAKEQAANPEFVGKLLDQLNGSPQQRDLAIVELRNLGPIVVASMLQRMQSTKDSGEQDLLTYALVKMGGMTIDPLRAGLSLPQESVRTRVIDVLGYLRADQAVLDLYGIAFGQKSSPPEKTAALRALGRILYNQPDRADRLSDVVALNALEQRTRDYLSGHGPLPLMNDGQVSVWVYDSADNLVGERQLAPALASAYFAARTARMALGIRPDRPQTQQLYLTSYLAYETALGNPAGQTASMLRSMSPELLSAVLTEALKVGQPGPAVRVIDALADQRSELALQVAGGVQSPLKNALSYPDERVRFAAATAILQLAPKNFEAYSHQIAQILTRSLSTGTEPKAIVIDADETRSAATVGYLADLGFESIRVETGQQGFKEAAASSQCALVVIHVNVARWELSQTLANFRADARTAALPILLYGPESVRSAVTRQLTQYTPILFVAESSTLDGFDSQTREFLARYAPASLTPQERAQMRGDALAWLADLSRPESAVKVDLSSAQAPLLSLVDDAQLGPLAQRAVLSIGTRDVQSRLAEVAANNNLPENVRLSAVRNLLAHVQRFGWAMTATDEKKLFASLNDMPDGSLADAVAALQGSRTTTTNGNSVKLQKFPLPDLPAMKP